MEIRLTLSTCRRWLFACGALVCASLAAIPASAQFSAVPRDSYYFALNEFHAGDYRNALRDFQSEYRGAIKAPNRWIDSICHHTMVGECYYQSGMLAEARDEYNAAINLFAVHADWMLSMQWRDVTPLNPGQITNCPWGRSARPAAFGNYPETVSIFQGRVNNNAVIQQGGVVQPAVNFPLRYQEILRCTMLSLRRRRELMGVIARHDTSSNSVVGAFTGTAGKPVSDPNHWSTVFASLQAGLAYTAAGNDAQAYKLLEAGLYAGGQYVHPFTGMAYFELGRIKMSLGKFDEAQALFMEATYPAFQYNDYGLLEEAFRYGQMAHLLSNKPGIFPPLTSAIAWTKRSRDLRHLHASLNLLLAENAALRNDLRTANLALTEARNTIGVRDLANSKVGARYQYMLALTNYMGGKVSAGDDALSAALNWQRKGSLWLFHQRLADSWYSSGSLNPRDAIEIYSNVLREPTAADWLSDPLETMSSQTDAHSSAIERWFHVAMDRNEKKAALEIADLCRRHRYFSTLPFGGRLLSLRWMLECPDQMLTPPQLLERQSILGQFPGYAALKKQADALRLELKQLPVVIEDLEQQKKQADLFKSLAAVSVNQETILREISIRRQPCDMTFPPKLRVDDIQQALPDHQAVLAYFATPLRIYGFLITKNDYETWEVGAPALVYDKVAVLLRQMGHIDGNRVMPLAQLQDESWRKPAKELLPMLFKGVQTDFPNGIDELVIVPDGVLWYLPFELLGSSEQSEAFDGLLSRVRVRYAPTVGLSVPDARGRNKTPATVAALGKIYPRDEDQVSQDAFDQLLHDIPAAQALPKKLFPAPLSLYSSFFDQMIVYDDIAPTAAPLGANLVPAASGLAGSSLDNWLSLPWAGPEVVVLPGFHSAAESSMKKIKPEMAGADVFLPIMGLMSSGSRTILMSRWRTGGKTSFDLSREFVRELPFTSAADAWQRSVFLAIENPLRPSEEPRLQLPMNTPAPKPRHPFFWSGYALIDSGFNPQTPTNEPPIPLIDAKLEEKRKLLEQLQKEEAAKKLEANK